MIHRQSEGGELVATQVITRFTSLLWVMGRHRVFIADCREAESIQSSGVGDMLLLFAGGMRVIGWGVSSWYGLMMRGRAGFGGV